jgi:PAS domain-containing protein
MPKRLWRVREPLVVLDAELRVVSANRAFYKYFQVFVEEVNGRFLYELGNRQWDIPALRKLLAAIITHDEVLENFEVKLDIEKIGRKKSSSMPAGSVAKAFPGL